MTIPEANFLPFLLDLTCAIQQIPSPTFSESRKAEFMLEQFVREGLRDVHQDSAGNVLACLTGGPRRPLVVSAHMDTVHPLKVSLSLQRTASQLFGPSIGDNSLGVASLIGLVRLLRARDVHLPGDLWLAANTCEEGLGDLRGMTALVEKFDSTSIAYIVVEGMGLGQIYHRGLGVERYRISAHTAGGHSWVDYGKPSAIEHLAGVITKLVAIPVPHQPRTVLNVGVFEGGTSINTIAAHASFDLDLRSENSGTLRSLVREVKRVIDAANQPGVTVDMERIGKRPAGEIPASHPLVQLAQKCLLQEGITPHLEIASTDANIPLSRGFPAICIGLTGGGHAHTTAEFLDIEPVQRGMGQLLRLVLNAWTTEAH